VQTCDIFIFRVNVSINHSVMQLTSR